MGQVSLDCEDNIAQWSQQIVDIGFLPFSSTK